MSIDIEIHEVIITMDDKKQLQIELVPNNEMVVSNEYDFDKIIFDLDSQVDLLSSQADKYDYLVPVGSGILCGMLDIFWVGEFNLERGRNIASDKIDEFVKKTAKMLGCKDNDLQSSVKSLKRNFLSQVMAIRLILVVDCNITCGILLIIQR